MVYFAFYPACIANCANCTSETDCGACMAGFALDEETGSCIESEVVCIDTNCATCSDPNTCTLCSEGFTLDDSGKCKKGREGMLLKG